MRDVMRRSVLPAALLLMVAAGPLAAQQPPAPDPAVPTQQQGAPATGGLPTVPPQMGIAPASPAHPALPPSTSAPQPAPVAAATLPHDLSPWGMFMAADIVVKAVMVGLAFASVVTWSIWLAKALELGAAKMRAGRALRRLEEADDLPSAAGHIAGKSGKLSEIGRAHV